MKLVNDINREIFRGYDIRGIYGTDLTEDVAYTIGKGFGSYVQELGETMAVVGHDNRMSSPELSNAFIKGAIETGLSIINIGMVTTPMYYFSWGNLSVNAGAMITASHNPKEYNGFKVAFDERGNACGDMITDFYEYIQKGEFKSGNGTLMYTSVEKSYLELLKSSIELGSRKLKVVVDCGNGTASEIVHKVFAMFDIEVQYIFSESDPNFPNHHPDPCEEKNMEFLKAKVLEIGADIGLGFDGDADRIGVIDETGKMIFVDSLMIIVWRDIFNKVKNRRALFDVKCSKALPDELLKLGLEPVCYRTGNSYMKAMMKKGDFDFGGEFSGHIFFRDKFPGFDDGIYAGLRFVEILSKTDKPFSRLLDGVNKYYSSPEIKIKTTDVLKVEKVEKIKEYCIQKGYKINTIDGVRAEFEDGWALVRSSNTAPDITTRFEGLTKERMEEIKAEFMKVLED